MKMDRCFDNMLDVCGFGSDILENAKCCVNFKKVSAIRKILLKYLITDQRMVDANITWRIAGYGYPDLYHTLMRKENHGIFDSLTCGMFVASWSFKDIKVIPYHGDILIGVYSEDCPNITVNEEISVSIIKIPIKEKTDNCRYFYMLETPIPLTYVQWQDLLIDQKEYVAVYFLVRPDLKIKTHDKMLDGVNMPNFSKNKICVAYDGFISEYIMPVNLENQEN